MLKLRYALPTVALVLGAFCWLFVWTPWVRALNTTSLTGTIADAQGNGVNGILTLQLPVPAQFNVNNAGCGGGTSQIVQNGVVTYTLINGAIQSGPPVFDVACLSPANLFYIATVYDRAGNLLMRGNYVITGTAPFNIGTATPTTVTTSNISYANVGGSISTGQPNTWTAPQTFAQINSNTGSIAASGLFRLANSDVIAWRNGNNTSDLQLGLSDSASGCTNAAPCLIAGGASQTFSGTGACVANQFVNTLNPMALAIPGAPTCSQPSALANSSTLGTGSSGTNIALTTPTIGGTTISNVPWMGWGGAITATTVTGNQSVFPLNGGGITLKALNIQSAINLSCTGYPTYTVTDNGSNTALSITLSATNNWSSTSTINVTAGHTLALAATGSAGSGCNFQILSFTVSYLMQ